MGLGLPESWFFANKLLRFLSYSGMIGYAEGCLGVRRNAAEEPVSRLVFAQNPSKKEINKWINT